MEAHSTRLVISLSEMRAVDRPSADDLMRAPLRFVPCLEAAIKDSVLEADAAYFEKVDEVRVWAAPRSCALLPPPPRAAAPNCWRAHRAHLLVARRSTRPSAPSTVPSPVHRSAAWCGCRMPTALTASWWALTATLAMRW